MAKTYEEINERIRKGEAVVLTAEEMTELVASEGAQRGRPKSGRRHNGDVRADVLLGGVRQLRPQRPSHKDEQGLAERRARSAQTSRRWTPI